METRRDHRNSTKDFGNLRKKNKESVGRGKKARNFGGPVEGGGRGPAEGESALQSFTFEHGRWNFEVWVQSWKFEVRRGNPHHLPTTPPQPPPMMSFGSLLIVSLFPLSLFLFEHGTRNLDFKVPFSNFELRTWNRDFKVPSNFKDFVEDDRRALGPFFFAEEGNNQCTHTSRTRATKCASTTHACVELLTLHLVSGRHLPIGPVTSTEFQQ